MQNLFAVMKAESRPSTILLHHQSEMYLLILMCCLEFAQSENAWAN